MEKLNQLPWTFLKILLKIIRVIFLNHVKIFLKYVKYNKDSEY